MKSTTKYASLDDIGFVGVQESKSELESKYHTQKTADVFKKARAEKSVLILKVHKKAS